MIGPPSVAPVWFRLRPSGNREKKPFAFISVFRTNQKALPCTVFVPLLVTMLTEPAELLPTSRPELLVTILNSCTASGNGNARLVLNRLSLLSPPSSVYLSWFWREPFTESALTPGAEYAPRPASPLGALDGCTPATRRVRSARLRPFSGRSTTRRESTTSLMVALRVSTIVA